MLDECAAAGLPEPEFEERTGGLWVTFHKDILTAEHLRSLGLSERQIRAVIWAKGKGSITNREYRQLTGLSDEGARRDLNEIAGKGILRAEGKGRSVRYILPRVGN